MQLDASETSEMGTVPNRRTRCGDMNSFRNGFYFLGAVLLLICIGVIVWYAWIGSQNTKLEGNGTLAVNVERQVAL